MKQGFHHRLLNSPFEDPCLYIRIPWEKRAILFDLGDLRNLAAADLYKVTDVFVTHTHIDHFIGFDTLLRATLRRETPLNIYGPPAITGCVEGKLRGYTWNLIQDYPTVIQVFAYNGKTLSATVFRAENRFRKQLLQKAECDGVLLVDSLFSVRAVRLDHGIPCLAYAIEEQQHINIDKDRLIRKGLSVGPWLTEFKRMLRENADGSREVRVDGKRYRLDQILDIARMRRGQKVCYATDLAMTAVNMHSLVNFARGVDTLYCEAYFLEQDRERALERFHLTAKACGAIAGKAGVKRLELMHFSPKYRECPDTIEEEAFREFNAMRQE